jgi:hypothetical protein
VRALVTGSRTWDDALTIYNTVFQWWQDSGEPKNPLLISGACPKGADALMEYIWTRNGWPVERHPAQWDLHGKRAGFVRNAEMVRTNPDVLFAFIRDNSKGATHTLRLAELAGIPTIVTRM